MKCPNCGSELEKNWQFCPKCGKILKQETFDDIFKTVFNQIDFQNLFDQVKKNMEDMDDFEKNFEVLDLSPFFKPQTKKQGFTIKIRRSGDKKPKVEVDTFGGVNKEALRKEVYEELGIKPETDVKKVKERFVKAKTTVEPKANVKRVDSKVLVDIDLPKVKENDITIKQLENSVEVRAVTKDKAYFKLLTKPAQFRISKKSFEKGKLHLEFS